MLNLYSASTVQPWTMSEFFSHRTYNQSFLGEDIHTIHQINPEIKACDGWCGQNDNEDIGLLLRQKLGRNWHEIKCKLDHATIWFKHGNPSHFSHDKIIPFTSVIQNSPGGRPNLRLSVVFQPLTLIAAPMYCCNYPEDHTVIPHMVLSCYPPSLKGPSPK